jgi:mannan endo-1,4-beta-mannosidase
MQRVRSGGNAAQDYWLSIDRYVNWSSTAVGKNDFYTDWECRQMYKAHLNHFVHRVNTVNGRVYKEDPTIFYWDLMNEPRWCVGFTSAAVLL